MGLSPFKSCGGSCSCTPPPAPQPAPDPTKFTITRHFEHWGLCAVEVHYPGATNFGGKKIMVFKAAYQTIKHASVLDPHFCEKGHLSPIARFIPTSEGWHMALQAVLHHRDR